MTTDERLEKAEGQLARLKWINRCLIGCIVLSLGVWFVLKTFAPERAWAQSGAKEIRANKFVLEDENGKPCATLGYIEDKGPALLLLDKNDDVRAALGLTPDGSGLELIDENHKPRVRVAVDKDKPSLSLHDGNGKERASLMVGMQGPYLTLYDENAKLRADLAVSEGGSSLVLMDANGEERATLGENEQGYGLALSDANGEGV